MSALTRRLDDALAGIDAAEKLVGQRVPAEAATWASENGLAVVETSFAPPGALYIFGAIPVFWDAAAAGGGQAATEPE